MRTINPSTPLSELTVADLTAILKEAIKPEKQAYSAKEAAERLGVSKNTLAKWTKEGRIGSSKLGEGKTRSRRLYTSQHIADCINAGDISFQLNKRR